GAGRARRVGQAAQAVRVDPRDRLSVAERGVRRRAAQLARAEADPALMRAASRHHRRHGESHQTERFGWLRAAVLGANDGIVSTASLVLGVAAASGSHHSVMVAGVSGLVAGAMSMAAGEYVSVHSQADSEQAELDRERQELSNDAEAELRE